MKDIPYEDNDVAKTLQPVHKKLWDEVNACTLEIQNILNSPLIRVEKKGGYNAGACIAAYLLFKAAGPERSCEVSFEAAAAGIDPDILETAVRRGIPECWDKLIRLTGKYRQNVFLLSANLHELISEACTPDSITVIADRILNVKDGEKFADFGSGTGSAALSIRKEHSGIIACGLDKDQDAVAGARIRAELSGENIRYCCRDVFSLEDREEDKFDRIFANYPIGMNIRELAESEEYLSPLKKRLPALSKATSSDWFFNLKITDQLKTSGKAVAIMTNGSTWNNTDAGIREYFIENGLVEAVIALPAKMFYHTSLATSLIVFSRGNEGVRLVDASDQYLEGRRYNDMSDENIDFIISALSEDSDSSACISREVLRDNSYVLSLNRYIHDDDETKDRVPFQTLIRRITRGAQLNARELDAISSAQPTPCRYLMLANIQKGIIDRELPYIKEIDEKNRKYCLADRCLILSKNGYPFKVAVAKLKKDQKILANGNLYIIELDEEKTDPYYIAAYLNSEEGTKALKRIAVGAAIPNIGVESLKNLMIPLPDIRRQRELGSRYQALIEEIYELQEKLAEAHSRMAHIQMNT